MNVHITSETPSTLHIGPIKTVLGEGGNSELLFWYGGWGGNSELVFWFPDTCMYIYHVGDIHQKLNQHANVHIHVHVHAPKDYKHVIYMCTCTWKHVLLYMYIHLVRQ